MILYNFNKLSGYTFSADVVKKLAKDFPLNVVGMKDSSGNLWNNLKILNFSMFVGSEVKLLEGLKIGCVGVISATTNVTNSLARQVYDDFINNKKQTVNERLCLVRKAFEETENLISALHSYMSIKNEKYKYLLPPLNLLNKEKHEKLLLQLKELKFLHKKNITT
jgi:4-hydroxy-tetrahydrodipicolinate synthase